MRIKILDIYFIFFLIFIFFKIFIFYDHLYPIHDEIISIDRYLEVKNFLRRDSTNNQLLLSFFGMITKSIFGFNFVLLRMISFLSFVALMIIFRKEFKNFFLINILFSIILSSDLLFNYIYLYRGYYVASLIIVLNLYFLKKYFEKRKIKHLKYSLILSTLLCIHSIYSIYFLIPILFSIFIYIIIEKKFENIKIILKYFFLPSILIYFLIIYVTGFAQSYSGNLNLLFLINNLYEVLINSFMPGIKTIFFQSDVLDLKFSFTSVWIKMTEGESGIMITHQITILIIILLVILILISKLLLNIGKLNYLDLNIGIFFITFLIINKNPWLRVYVPIAFFLLFYLLNEIKNFLSTFKNKNKFKINEISFIILLFLAILVSPNRNYEQFKDEIIKIDKYKENCELANEFLTQKEIWILINFYPSACKYKYDSKLHKNITYK